MSTACTVYEYAVPARADVSVYVVPVTRAVFICVLFLNTLYPATVLVVLESVLAVHERPTDVLDLTVADKPVGAFGDTGVLDGAPVPGEYASIS